MPVLSPAARESSSSSDDSLGTTSGSYPPGLGGAAGGNDTAVGAIGPAARSTGSALTRPHQKQRCCRNAEAPVSIERQGRVVGQHAAAIFRAAADDVAARFRGDSAGTQSAPGRSTRQPGWPKRPTAHRRCAAARRSQPYRLLDVVKEADRAKGPVVKIVLESVLVFGLCLVLYAIIRSM